MVNIIFYFHLNEYHFAKYVYLHFACLQKCSLFCFETSKFEIVQCAKESEGFQRRVPLNYCSILRDARCKTAEHRNVDFIEAE